ncbi:vesicle-associated membrane protein 3 isoform X1 [Ursus arctos]|uniref:vesicle-associated membrane protein 3 isoform X1 n=1 Tax=Ursus arctos TaxID=9644 RepID=UPI0025469263|nr:vesicle-associated membrane protein 3 isoform X1 [Ursus arctos]
MSTGAPAGPSAASGSSRRLQQTQTQVDEVVDIMRVNVDKVLERDQKLSELDDRADALQAGASQFETSAAKLKRKYWWKNCKMWAIGIVVVVVIIIIIIGECPWPKLIVQVFSVWAQLIPHTRTQNRSSRRTLSLSKDFRFLQ